MGELITPDAARYEAVACLKRGSFSTVGLVRETETGLLYVTRRLPLHANRERLPRPLHHPGVQLFVKSLETKLGLWLLSEFTPGYPADRALEIDPQLGMNWVCFWLYLLLEAMDFLHAQSPPIHLGRLLPSDVVLSTSGPVIVDLGYGEIMGAGSEVLPPGPFEAPERLSADEPTAQMDLYSAGAFACLLLTGGPPQATGPETRKKLATLSSIPAPFLAVLSALLHPVPAARPASAQEALNRLRPLVPEEYPRPALPPALLPQADVPTPWVKEEEDLKTRPRVGTPPATNTLKITVAEVPAIRTEEPLTPGAPWQPRAVLKRSGYSLVTLLEHSESKVLAVGRRVRLPGGTQTEDVVQSSQGLAENFMAMAHPSVPRLRECLPDAEGVWFISNFIEGYPGDQLAGEKLEAGWVALWMRQLLEAVAYLHSQGIIIGVLQPSDVVLGPTGASIVDLAFYERIFPSLALIGLRGRQPFVAPERRTTMKDDASHDVFSIGAIAWYLLCRQPPEINTPSDTDNLVETLTRLRPDVPENQRHVLARMLSYRQASRYRSASEALQAVNELAAASLENATGGFTPGDPVPWLTSTERVPEGQPAVAAPARKAPEAPPSLLGPTSGPSAAERPGPPGRLPEPAPRPVPESVRAARPAPAEPEPPPWLRYVPVLALGSVAVVVLLSVVLSHHGPGEASTHADTPVLMTVTGGSAMVRPPGQTEWRAENSIRAGTQVQGGSHCVLTFQPGDTVRLNDGAVVQASRPAESLLALTCSQGRVWCHFTQGSASVSVPGAHITCDSPSDAEFDLTDPHHTVVICHHGKIVVGAAVGDPLTLPADHALTVFSNGAVHQRAAGPHDSWETWNEGLP